MHGPFFHQIAGAPDPVAPAGGAVVDVAIRRLRSKLDAPFEGTLLHTVRGMGYVLEARDE